MKNIILLASIFVFIGCSENPYKKEILGEWSVHSWVREIDMAKVKQKMDFVFTEDGRYQIDYGSEKEIGNFWFVNDDLITHEDGMTKKSVKVVLLRNDSLLMRMNRSGSIESVLLLKK